MKKATKANPALNDNQSGLAVSYPAATFDDKLAREVDTATEFETTAPTLANAVKTANLSDTARLQAEQTVREAGKAHLAHCCMIGACVQQVYHLASVSGLGIKPLLKIMLFKHFSKTTSKKMPAPSSSPMAPASTSPMRAATNTASSSSAYASACLPTVE